MKLIANLKAKVSAAYKAIYCYFGKIRAAYRIAVATLKLPYESAKKYSEELRVAVKVLRKKL